MWLSVSFACLLLVFTASADPYILTKLEEDTKYKVNYVRHDENKPFAHRHLGQANIWNLNLRTDKDPFVLHFIPRDHCQEVWLCSTPSQWTFDKIPEVLVPKTNNPAEKPCHDKVIFRPVEGSITVVNRGKAGITSVFPWASAKIYHHSDIGEYVVDVHKEGRNSQGEMKYPNGGKMASTYTQVYVKSMPLIITSSPYCKVVVQSDTNNGRPVDFARIGELPEYPFPAMKESDSFPKEFNNLLVPTSVVKYTVTKNTQCPPLWKSEFEPIEKIWHTNTAPLKLRSRFFSYTVKNQCKGGVNDKGTQRASFKLHVENPQSCNWVRLCFLEDANSMCLNATRSVELMYVYKLFVGVDSDQSKSFDVPASELSHIRFEVNEHNVYQNDKKYTLTMSYSFASDEGGVQHRMYVPDSWSQWLTGEQRVSLVRDQNCFARLISDIGLDHDTKKRKQCLSVAKCDVAKVTELQHYVSMKEMADINDLTQGL